MQFSQKTMDLIDQEFGHHMKMAAGHATIPTQVPSSSLISAVEADFAAAGGTVGAINWIALLPKIIALVGQYGPVVWQIVQQLISAFGNKPAPGPIVTPPTPTPPGPVITGS